MNIFDKLAVIQRWKLEDFNDNAETAYTREIGSTDHLPPMEAVDIVFNNGLENYINNGSFKSQEEIEAFISDTFNIVLNDKVLNDSKVSKHYPRIRNFFTYCDRIDKAGNLHKEAKKISETCWYGELAKKMLKEKTDKMFSVKPDKEIFKATCKEIKRIYGYTDKEIEAIQYFVCQVKDPKIDPSNNKSIYFWSNKQRTGKTSVVKTIIAILNGDENITDGDKYKSDFGREMQFGNFDRPNAITCNASFFEEAMPNDTKKTYDKLKDMLTSKGCNIEIKFGAKIHVDCRRNYLWTSNHDIIQFVRGDKERRFLTVNPDRMPVQISFEEIFAIWKTFCQHAENKKPFPEWYEDFEYIDGKLTADIEEAKSNILAHTYLLNEVNETKQSVISAGVFYRALTNNQTPKSEEKQVIKAACIELFGETIQKGGSTWSKSAVKSVLDKFIADNRPNVFDSEEDPF